MASKSRIDDAVIETKLRNSCDTCSTAKIKCTQEKPACAYCVKKLKVCVYGTSKRVRRTQRSHKQQQQQQQQQQQEHENQEQRRRRQHAVSESRPPRPTTALTSTASPPPYPSFGAMMGAELIPAQQTYPFVTPTDSGEQDWPDFLTALMEPYTSTELDSVGVSLDTFTYVEDAALNFSPPLSRLAQSHTSDRTRVQANQHASSVSGSVTSSSDFMPGSLARTHGSNTDETTFFPASPQIASGAAYSNSNHTCTQHRCPSRTGSNASRPARRCQCLMRVLNFMGQLSMEPSQAWDAGPDGEPSTLDSHSTNLELVSKGIRNISDGLDKILQCPCSHDTVLIMLLLLVIFKIQVCYIDAVNAITSEDDGVGVKNFRFKLAPQSSWNDAHDDDGDDDDDEHSGDEDQRRIFIQYVLSRLAGLRTLIVQLSERLVETKTFPSEARRPTVPQGLPYYAVVEGKIEITPLSASSLCTLASDLHNRLKGMSQAISEKLREV